MALNLFARFCQGIRHDLEIMGQVTELVSALITNIKLNIIVACRNLASGLLQAPNLAGLEEGIGHTDS